MREGSTARPLSLGVGKTATSLLSAVIPGIHFSSQASRGMAFGAKPSQLPDAHRSAYFSCGQTGTSSRPAPSAARAHPVVPNRLQMVSQSEILLMKYEYRAGPLSDSTVVISLSLRLQFIGNLQTGVAACVNQSTMKASVLGQSCGSVLVPEL